MKNNGGKSNILKTKTQQIKVNRKLINNSSTLNQSPSQNYYQYYPQKQNKLISEESKNVKFHECLDPNPYINKNVFTEYDSSPKYSIFPLNSIKMKNLSPNDARPLYNHTNGNIVNKEKNLNLKNKNKLNNNNEKNILKNYTNRDLGKVHKISSYKGNKTINVLQNNSNSNINQKHIFQKDTKLYGTPNEMQYPLMNHIIKNKYQSFNCSNSKNTENFNNEMGDINLAIQKIPHREKIKKYNIISPATNHNINKNKKTVRQNKSNIAIINNRKKTQLYPPKLLLGIIILRVEK